MLLLCIFVYGNNVIRIWYSFQVFGEEISYYFLSMFNEDVETPTLYFQLLVDEEFLRSYFLPENFDELLLNLGMLFRFFAVSDFWFIWLEFLAKFFSIGLLVVMFGFIFFVIMKISYSFMFKENENGLEQSKGVISYKKFEDKVLSKVIAWIKEEVDFILHAPLSKMFRIIFYLELAFMLNLYPLVIVFIGGIFYLSCSGNLLLLLELVFNIIVLFIDMVRVFSLPGLILLCLILFIVLRVKAAYRHLEFLESIDKNFVDKLGVVTSISGVVGSGKTWLGTDFYLTAIDVFRDKALNILNTIQLRWPTYNFFYVENFVKLGAFSNHYSVKDELHKLFRTYINEKGELIFDIEDKLHLFDVECWAYFDGLRYQSLLDNIIEYAQVYYIYKSELGSANYSIRTSDYKKDLDHFPLYVENYFKEKCPDNDYYSKIVDFDSFRLKKQIDENDKFKDIVCFGVFSFTELDKERGNAFENRGIKKTANEANQMNDGFNQFLKLIRHKCTIGHTCFFKMFYDGQRKNSINGDLNSIAENLIYLRSASGEDKSTLTFVSFFLQFPDFIVSFYKRFINHFRFYREDTNLFSYLFSKLASKCFKLLEFISKTFSYRVLELDVNHGDIDGNTVKDEPASYYRLYKKVGYRYSTDCYQFLFEDAAISSEFGLNDMPNYQDIVASREELLRQNSYFFNELFKKRGEEPLSQEDESGLKDEVSSDPDSSIRFDSDFFGGNLK